MCHNGWYKLGLKYILILNFALSTIVCTEYDCDENENKTSQPICVLKNYVKETTPSAFKNSRIIIRKDLRGTERWISLDVEVKKHIWMPDLNIYRAEKIFKPGVLSSESFKMNGKHEFYNFIEFTAKTKCQMDLREFPHDVQKCILEIGSVAHSDDFQLLKLDKGEYSSTPQPNEYTIRRKKFKKTVAWRTGNFTTVGLEFTMIRRVSFYILNYYIPTGIMVIISFAAFAMPASNEGLIGRMSFLVTLMLVVMGIFNAAKSNLPASDVPNFIEIWMIVCIKFVLGAFTQSTFIFLARRIKLLKALSRKSTKMVAPIGGNIEAQEQSSISNDVTNSVVDENADADQEILFAQIDYVSIILFSTFFLLFNICFWSITII